MKQIMKDIENNLYKIIVKSLNEVIGKEKTNFLSTGLFLKLPIILDFVKNKDKETSLKDEEYLLNSLSAYTKHNDNISVYFTFIYKDKKDLQRISNEIEQNKYNYSFIYLHELQHILRRHITEPYNNMMLRIADNQTLINMAEDYAINASLKELFELSNLNIKGLLELSCYDIKYENKSEPEMLKDLLNENVDMSETSINDVFKKIEISIDEERISTKIENTDSTSSGSNNNMNQSIELSDLADEINSMLKESLRGTKQGEIFERAFEATKVDTKWFSKLQKKFKRNVYYATNKFYASWNNLNNKYRHIFKSPKKKFLDSKIEMYLSVDQSGSMSEEELGKILHIIETEGKHISKLTVLIHDMKINKAFELENLYDISKSTKFKEALAMRYLNGGTSHKEVFEYLQENIKEPDKVIYMCFSDMYSDIEENLKRYPILKKISNYWISTEKDEINYPGVKVKI